MIGMYEGVHQCFAQGFVDMGFLQPRRSAVQFEGHVQAIHQSRINPIVEIEQVWSPLAVDGQPIGPALFWIG